MADEKRQKSLHEAMVHTVKPGQVPGQFKSKHQAQKGGGPKKDQGHYKKKKRPAKKGDHGGQAFKQAHPASKGGGKSDAHP